MSLFISPPPYSEAAIPQPPTHSSRYSILPTHYTNTYSPHMANNKNAIDTVATLWTEEHEF